jgi:hypothetical protein
MLKGPKASQFVWAGTVNPEIADFMKEALTHNLPRRWDDPAIVRDFVDKAIAEQKDESLDAISEEMPDFIKGRGPRRLRADEMPSTKEVSDFYAEHPELRPSKYEDVPNGNHTAKGFRITKQIQSSEKADPRLEIPEWAEDDRVVLDVLSCLYAENAKISKVFEVINHRWRNRELAEGSRILEMSEKAIKQLLYRVRKCGDESLALAPNGKWFLKMESFRRVLSLHKKKRKIQTEKLAFYERYLSGEKIHMWDWPADYVKVALVVVQKKDPARFDWIFRDIEELLEVVKEIKRPELPLFYKAQLWERIERLDPFYAGVFNFTTD